MFRAAATQRGSKVPTKEQLAKLKAQKLAALSSQEPTKSNLISSQLASVDPSSNRPSLSYSTHAPPSSSISSTGVPKSSNSTKGQLPPDFYDSNSKQAIPEISPSSAPKSSSSKSTATDNDAKSKLQDSVLGSSNKSLPEGFFANKSADEKARNIKALTAEEKQEEFNIFQAELDEDLLEQEGLEAEEERQQAEERAELESIEHRIRIARVKALQRRAHGLAKNVSSMIKTRKIGDFENDDAENEAVAEIKDDEVDVSLSVLSEISGSELSTVNLALNLHPLKRRRVMSSLKEIFGDDKDLMSGTNQLDGKVVNKTQISDENEVVTKETKNDDEDNKTQTGHDIGIDIVEDEEEEEERTDNDTDDEGGTSGLLLKGVMDWRAKRL